MERFKSWLAWLNDLRPTRAPRHLRLWVALAAVLCMLPALLVVKRAVSSEAATPYITSPVLRTDIEYAVLATGILEGHQQVDVGAQVSGQLKTLYVHLGERVEAGTPLAEIDPVLSQSALRIAESSQQSLEAQRSATLAGLTQARLAYSRQKTMLDQDATSKQEVEAALAQLEVIKANLASFDAQIRQAAAQVASARANLAYTRITAPIGGEVVAIVTQPGQTVVASQQAPVILKLADRSIMSVKAQVSEADVARIQPGQAAWFTLIGNAEQRFEGTLRAVEPVPGDYLASTAPGGKTGPVFYNAIFEVPNPQGIMRIGMTAQVSIVLARAMHALAIPMAALGPPDAQNRYAVRVMRGPRVVQTVYVHLGVRDNLRVQVLDVLKEGDEVITDEAPQRTGTLNGSRTG